MQFLDTLTGSPNPQFRILGRQARRDYLEEREKLASIPITPYDILLNKSHEVSARLREAMMSDDNSDAGVTAQLDKPADSSTRTFHAGLSQSEQDKYEKNHKPP